MSAAPQTKFGEAVMNFPGIQIIAHTLAREVRDEFRIERHPIKKRRRQWRIVKHRIDRPCAFQIGNTIYMHPELIAKLKDQEP